MAKPRQRDDKRQTKTNGTAAALGQARHRLGTGPGVGDVAGCQTSKQGNEGSFSLSDRVEYSAAYDKELESIFSLSERGKWEEAEAEVGLLIKKTRKTPR